MIRTCDICGKEENEKLMEPINTGRRTEWWCWECYLNSQREATASEMARQQRLHRISESKDRNK